MKSSVAIYQYHIFRVILMTILPQSDYTNSLPILTEYRDLLSVQDLSNIFQTSRQTIYKELKDGKFGTPIQIGRAYKIPKIYVVQRYFQTQ